MKDEPQVGKKSRQEQAYEAVSADFLKLLQNDTRISHEHKQSVIAFWQDLFTHEGVQNNMVQAFSNFLWEIDKKMDAARKAGIDQLRSALMIQVKRAVGDNGFLPVRTIDVVANQLLTAENEKEETLTDIEKTDLSEVGGGNEDNTPLM